MACVAFFAVLGALSGASFAPLGCGRVDTVVGAESTPPIDGVDAGGAHDASCDPSSIYLAIASAQLAGGFTIQTDPSAPGGEYLSPPPGIQAQTAPGDASADYAFTVACPSDYFLWGRIRGPGADSNSFWVSVDDGTFFEWRLSTGVTWFWKAATSGTAYGVPLRFPLDGGAHRLVFRNGAPGVGLAGLYVAIPGDVPPGNDTPCDPPNSIQLEDGGCEDSCGSLGGNACSVSECAGQTMLIAYDCAACCHLSPSAEAGIADATAE
jgi:hypothetical protein